MFAEYFQAAEKHLRAIGRASSIDEGRAVSDPQLDEVERAIQRPIPSELRSFFREMGDGYRFLPDEQQGGFMLGLLSDYRYKVAGFAKVLREDSPPEQCRAHPPDVAARELARRERWFPFYNFGGGGYVFCLDLNESPPPVRHHDSVYWLNDPVEQWDFRLADSLLDLVREWSRYCFADAKGVTLINLALNASGRFDWAPSRFNAIYDRGTTEA